MVNKDLSTLGKRIAELRIAQQLKQTELAYESGVSHRTLQRLEAGEVVKSDGLVRVISYLGRLEGVMAALDAPDFSPYERLADSGLTVSQLKKPGKAPPRAGGRQAGLDIVKSTARKRRVRRPREAGPRMDNSTRNAGKAVQVQWPEDQH